MKKFVTSLLAAVICANAMASVLVYDYTATFKRIEVKSPVKVRYQGETYELDSPKVASDKFTGFMVIEACKGCGTDAPAMDYSSEPAVYDNYPALKTGNYAVFYIKRAGSKSYASKYAQLESADGIPYRNSVYRAVGRFYAAMFGAKSGWWDLTPGNPTVHVNPDKYTDATAFFSYHIKARGDNNPTLHVFKPGFLGVDQVSDVTDEFDWMIVDDTVPYHHLLLGQDFDTVDHAGYGKIAKFTDPGTAGTGPDCFNPGTPGTDPQNCWYVKNISGQMHGGFKYAGYCAHFLVDICNSNYITYEAPINGTFSIKLNNKMSLKGKNLLLSSFGAAEAAILGGYYKLSLDNNNKYPIFADSKETEEFNAAYAKTYDVNNPQTYKVLPVVGGEYTSYNVWGYLGEDALTPAYEW